GATVLLVVTAAGAAPPIALDDTLTTTHDTSNSVFVLGNDIDPDRDELSVTGVTTPAHGTAECIPSGTCVYTPDAGYVGPGSFDSPASAGTETATATVSVTVLANRPPVASDDSQKTAVDAPLTFFPTGNDVDPDDDSLVITSATPTAGHGTVACDSFSCTYTPTAGFTGVDTFDYTVSDGTASDTGTVIVRVGVNAPPAANADFLVTKKTSSDAAVFVLDNDADAEFDTLTVTATTDPPHGTASCQTDGDCLYTPDTDYIGPDSFTYTISDGT